MIKSYIETIGGFNRCARAIGIGLFLSLFVYVYVLPNPPIEGRIGLEIWNEALRLQMPETVEVKEFNPVRYTGWTPGILVFHLKVNFPTEKDTQLFFESIDANGWKHVGGNHLYKKQMQNGKELELQITRVGNEVSLDMREV